MDQLQLQIIIIGEVLQERQEHLQFSPQEVQQRAIT